ncbi:hypothetical protein PInf_024559 [Phytophthora infestans]|nr:hypothetical protein PInf_024559 [Phytophthora infestans]
MMYNKLNVISSTRIGDRNYRIYINYLRFYEYFKGPTYIPLFMKEAKSGGNYNPIENCFSAFKAMVKRFLARHRQAILRVPPHLTIKAHRESYLKLAADLLVLEAITPELCYKCSLHTMKFHARAIQMKDMPVGE